MSRQVSIAECLALAPQLEAVSDSARLDTEVLLAQALAKERSFLYAWPEKPVDGDALLRFKAMFKRRQQREPVAYIVGEQEFWSLPLLVDSSTLIPRPDTECLVELALQVIPRDTRCRVLDLGTGSGAIALAIAKERPLAQLVASDFSPQALAVAEHNARRHSLDNVELLLSDWFQSVQGVFDVIVSNPPYLDNQDPHLDAGDLCFEPRHALVASVDGLGDIRTIIGQAPQYLKSGGYLMIEHGWQQGEQVRSLLLQGGYCEVVTKRDYGNNDRIGSGRYVRR